MIASLHGTITYRSPEMRKDSYVVVTCAGVGYKVYTPVSNLQRVDEGAEATFYTYLAVSENSMDLYGFLNPADKTFFTLLLDVPGVGPKTAIATLEKTTMADVQQAIFANDALLLVKSSGLSQKMAEKIIVTLKDKVESLTSRSKGENVSPSIPDADVFDALTGFGYTTSEARKALSQIDPSITENGKRLREALRILGKRQ
jgi:Holliday junction DNA helicase RuvA